MRVLVAPARHVRDVLRAHEVDVVLSLISPDAETPDLSAEGVPGRVVRFNDIAEPRDGLIPASRETLQTILGLAGEFRTILIHCHAGVSRSTAAAYVLACQHVGPGQEDDLARALRSLSPVATPNPLMIALADDLLARHGRMVSAINSIGRGAETYEGCLIDWTF